MIEAFRFTVSDRPVCEQRGETAPARILKRELPFHVQEGFLLSRETCIGKVLGGGAATHGNGRVINSRATAELPISSQYIFRDEGRHLRLQEQATNGLRSDEHTSELQSLMRNSSAVFCLKKKTHKQQSTLHT